jgi:magnesium chelatase family protein
VVADRVVKARATAVARWAGSGWRSNAEVPGTALRSPRWRLPRSVLAPVREQLDRGELSARGFDRVLRLAWTIGDLAGRTRPDGGDVGEATELRRGEVR